MDSATTVKANNDRTIETVGLLNHAWLNLLADERLREEADLRYLIHIYTTGHRVKRPRRRA
jgi:predicted nucleotidyltransferase